MAGIQNKIYDQELATKYHTGKGLLILLVFTHIAGTSYAYFMEQPMWWVF